MKFTYGRVAAAAAVSLSVVLTGCGGGDGTDDSENKADGPVTLTWWSWDETKWTQPVADKFNATHDDIKIKLVKQADNPGTAQNVRNAVAAGEDVPCLVKNFGEVPGLVGEGLLTNVDEPLQQYLDKGLYNETSLPPAQAGGAYYAVPTGFTPTFMMINRAVYDRHGVQPPKTWDDVITTGKELKKHGVYVMNLAGEDPSTLVTLVQQAGGSWYEQGSDAWQIDFLSPESLKAADVVQQLVDNGLVANQTYQDRPALIEYFDSGKMVSLPTSTWQLTNYEVSYKKSLGDWQPIDYPQFADAASYTTPGASANSGLLVPKGCEHVEEAVEAGVWMTTSKDAIDASYQKDIKQYTWPGAVKDPSPWVDSVVPDKLFGEYKSEAREVILKSVAGAKSNWVVGPNYTGVFAELQDQWAKIVTKKITVRQALEHLQEFTVKDLKSKNINVEG
ncbi:extracellular solute-binding protein [Streptomyces phaeoluteigriseus]|uniref:Extracellular solute-binding protein n=1 Tax=Streptomyces phaeoluteigriseus TaxID=114686 RepID=A0ABY4ZAX2_9ACTN|nr:extracellular solute-binding protein [Streptomyces phaeoluteigriseus]USQ86188.1 extracellular solute-binding protein [Streptomyces phaeoluteigriseus]